MDTPGGAEDNCAWKNKTYIPNFEVKCISEDWTPNETFGKIF